MKHSSLRFFLFLAPLCCLFFSCHDKSFSIEGHIDGIAEQNIYIEELATDGAHFLDSIFVDKNGNFEYQYQPAYESFFYLHVSPINFITLIAKAGENITVEGAAEDFSMNYDVKGSAGSIEMLELQQFTNIGFEKLRKIVDMDIANKEQFGISNDRRPSKQQLDGYLAAKDTTDSLYRDAYLEQRQFITQFLDNHLGSLSTLMALYKPFGPNHPIIDIKNDPELFQYYLKVLDGLKQALPNNPHTANFAQTVSNIEQQMQNRRQQEEEQNAQDLQVVAE